MGVLVSGALRESLRKWWVGIRDHEQARSWARHMDPVPSSSPRLARLEDYLGPSDLIGERDWCDGRLLPCPKCGRCCPCRHTERKPGYTEEHR